MKFQESDKDEVHPIKIIDDGNGGFNMDLISRKEDTQVTYRNKVVMVYERCIGERFEGILLKCHHQKEEKTRVDG